MINPLAMRILGAVVRAALLYGAGRLGVKLAESEVLEIVTFIVPLLVLAWSVWAKHHNLALTQTALALPPGSTLADAKAEVKGGNAPPASLAENRAPLLQSEWAAAEPKP